LESVLVVLGLLLLLASGALTAGVLIENTDAVTISAYGQSASGLTLGGLFLGGVITGAIAILGLTMMMAGLSRRRARRVGIKREMRDVRDERETLAEENARLRDELAASKSTYVADTVYPDDDTIRAAEKNGRHADTDSTDRPGLFHR
jgi:hypothetical protein